MVSAEERAEEERLAAEVEERTVALAQELGDLLHMNWGRVEIGYQEGVVVGVNAHRTTRLYRKRSEGTTPGELS